MSSSMLRVCMLSFITMLLLLAHAEPNIRPSNCEVVMMPKQPLQTERMQLRLVDAADEQAYMAFQSDPRVYKPSNSSPELGRLLFDFASTRSVSRIMRSDLVAVINDEVIGTLSLTENRDHMQDPEQLWLEVGFVFTPEHWGKGFATEAVLKLQEFAFTRIFPDGLIAITNNDNPGSQRVLEKTGFTPFKSDDRQTYWKLEKP